MKAAAKSVLLKREIESALEHKNPSVLTPRPREIRERLASAIPQLDALMQGGLPVGAITELVGVIGSGRTTAATCFLSEATRAGKVAAWVDVSDTLCPVSAALNGVDLARLLWIRCTPAPPQPQKSRAPQHEPVPCAALRGFVMPPGGCGSPHPRNEVAGMPEAIQAVLDAHGGLQQHQSRRERKIIGTPGAPNRPLTHSPHRQEQVPTDRRPTRRAIQNTQVPRCAEALPHQRKTQASLQRVAPHIQQNSTGTAEKIAPIATTVRKRKSGRPWTALENGLRTTDLLLQSGGFGLIVLDLASVAPEMAWRIPLATWFRYRATCDRSRTALLVLSQHACARSSAELVVRMHSPEIGAETNVMTGLHFRAEVERHRFAQPPNVIGIRKPPQSERAGCWTGRAPWAV